MEVGATWHAAFSGIPPIHRTEIAQDRVPEWRPWPGEEVRIQLFKPGGVAGQTLTIDAAVTLTIPPGKHRFDLLWRQPAQLGMSLTAPPVDLKLPSTNSVVRIDLSEAPRWILWLSGPRMGPAVHFWSVAMVLLLLGWALARSRLPPLRMHDWVLLGLGLLQLDLPWALVVPTSLLVLGWCSRQPKIGRAWLFDLCQLALVLALIASVSILFAAVRQGLLQHPDMRVMGNGASELSLPWYQDRSAGVLPRPWVFSLPILLYRIAILAWALWLAVAGIRWSRWGWERLVEQGLWSPLRKKKAPGAPPRS